MVPEQTLFPERHNVVGESRGLEGRVQVVNKPWMLGREAGDP